ncbi:MAG TPA: DUF4321 domain-containing protein [Gemmatimonadaceae bacterium]
MPPRGSAKHRPGFHALVLSIGFIVGGAFTEIARRWLPAGAVKEFLTTGVTPAIGPLPIDLVIIKFSVGPVALDVSLLSLVGVLVAYLIARSLF